MASSMRKGGTHHGSDHRDQLSPVDALDFFEHRDHFLQRAPIGQETPDALYQACRTLATPVPKIALAAAAQTSSSSASMASSRRNRLNLHSEVWYWPFCQCYLRRIAAVNQRYVVTLPQVLFLTHCGYRCQQEECPGFLSQRSGRWIGSLQFALWT